MLVIGTDLDYVGVGDFVRCDVKAIWIGDSFAEDGQCVRAEIRSLVRMRAGIVGSDNLFNPWPCLGERYERCSPFFPAQNICVIRPTRAPVRRPLVDELLYPQDRLLVEPYQVLTEALPANRNMYTVAYKVTSVDENFFTRRDQFITMGPHDFFRRWSQAARAFY